jgi:hypothetical protein
MMVKEKKVEVTTDVTVTLTSQELNTILGLMEQLPFGTIRHLHAKIEKQVVDALKSKGELDGPGTNKSSSGKGRGNKA